MANTYTQIYIHVVFAVKHRKSSLKNEWKKDFFAVIGNLINETGSKTIIVNGMEDHVHCFIGYKPKESISDIIQSVKSKSSRWLNKSGKLNHRFEWQKGYGAFSYSKLDINRVYNYIKNQEEHHKKMSFKEEYIDLLKRFNVEYDEKYIFQDLI